MYVPFRNRGIITPMKTGTHTIHKIGKEMTEPRQPIVQGHLKYQDMKNRLLKHKVKYPEIAMHVRDPLDRMVSVINHQYSKRKSPSDPTQFIDLDHVFQLVRQREQNLFPAQIEFWDWRVELFPFEGFPILRWLGWEGEIPHEYKAIYRFSKQEIEKHPICNYIMEKRGYQADYMLRKEVGMN